MRRDHGPRAHLPSQARGRLVWRLVWRLQEAARPTRSSARAVRQAHQDRRTQAELQFQHFDAVKAKILLRREVRSDIRAIQGDIDALEDKVKLCKKNGTTPPEHARRLQKWQGEIAKLEAMVISPPSHKGGGSASAAPQSPFGSSEYDDDDEEGDGEHEEEVEEEGCADE